MDCTVDQQRVCVAWWMCTVDQQHCNRSSPTNIVYVCVLVNVRLSACHVTAAQLV